MKQFFTFVAIGFWLAGNAQNVGVGTSTPQTTLDVKGGMRIQPLYLTGSGTSIIIPDNESNINLAGTFTGPFAATIATPQDGQKLLIDNNSNQPGLLNGTVSIRTGLNEYRYSNGEWKIVNSNGWTLNGNAGTTVSNYIGTSDAQPIRLRTHGNRNVALFDNVKYNYHIGGGLPNGASSTGQYNVSLGYLSSTSFTTGSENVSLGLYSLFSNKDGDNNIAIGSGALRFNKTGRGNVGIGQYALQFDTSSNGNVAIGPQALQLNVNRSANTAIGASALQYNTNTSAMGAKEGELNTAVGAYALYQNLRGSGGVAVGAYAAFSDTAADGIIAIGRKALFNAMGKTGNVAIGDSAMFKLGSFPSTFGNFNTAIGSNTLNKLEASNSNTAVGYNALAETTGGGNTALGSFAGKYIEGFDNIIIGAANSTSTGSQTVSRSIFLGNGAGLFENTSDKMYIENSTANKDNALIYGDFVADSLLLNAKTINRNSFNIRTNNALEMGYGTPGKQTDAGKICYGCFGDPAQWLGIVGGGTNNLGNDRVIKLWSEGGLRIKGNAMPDFGSTYTLGNQAAAWRSATTDSVRSNAYMLRNSAMHIVGAAGQLGFRLNSIDVAKINSAGIMPAQDNDIYLGGPTLRFVAVYAVNGMIQTSDARLKTNIASSRYGLDEVMKMQPVQYNWKSNPNNDLQIGFLAQDIQKIIPEAVVEPANGDPMGMKYTELIPVLVKAIQEQQKKIEELEKLVKALQQ